MLNLAIFSHRLICRRLCGVFVLLGCIFISMTMTPCVQAQEAASDPVADVEVGSTTVWRDAVTEGNITVTCTDAGGNPVPNAPVSISIGSPGTIVSPPNGDGTTDNSGNVYVTVKSTDFTAEGQDKLATLSATSEGISGTSTVLFEGPLEISVNGPADTGATTPCSVGEVQDLSATVLSGVNIGYIYFTASGATPIGGWDGGSSPNFTTTTPFPPNSKSSSTAQLYLTTTGSDTTTVTATDTDATGASVATGTANTYFNVSSPNDLTFTAQQNAPVPGVDVLSLGSFKSGVGNQGGIYFTGTGGAGGTLSFGQILNSMNAIWTATNGTTEPISPQANSGGLDAAFPYPTPGGSSATSTTNDSPSSNNQGSNTADINYKSFNATMYLMWTSNKYGSLPIPVESLTWSWYGEAKFNSSTSNGTLVQGSPAVPKIKGAQYNQGVLTWATTWNKGSN